MPDENPPAQKLDLSARTVEHFDTTNYIDKHHSVIITYDKEIIRIEGMREGSMKFEANSTYRGIGFRWVKHFQIF